MDAINHGLGVVIESALGPFRALPAMAGLAVVSLAVAVASASVASTVAVTSATFCVAASMLSPIAAYVWVCCSTNPVICSLMSWMLSIV